MNNNNHPEEDMANEQEINRKRKSNSHENTTTATNNFQIPRSRFSDNLKEHEDENDVLTLSLSFGPTTLHRSQQQPPPSPPQSVQSLLSQPPTTHNAFQLSSSHPLYKNPFPHHYTDGHSSHHLMPTPPPSQPQPQAAGPTRTRRNPTQAPRGGKNDIVPQPYPWATTRRATVHSLTYLESEQIVTISGDVQCKRCEKQYEMDFDLREKFYEVGSFIVKNRGTMHDRAPSVWMNPILPACKYCDQENSVKPIISEKKKTINWLFLLLGQMLGCCTLEQLKYFCKHTKNHRTGAKDRVLYLTYLGICKQLDPKGPFDR